MNTRELWEKLEDIRYYVFDIHAALDTARGSRITESASGTDSAKIQRPAPVALDALALIADGNRTPKGEDNIGPIPVVVILEEWVKDWFREFEGVEVATNKKLTVFQRIGRAVTFLQRNLGFAAVAHSEFEQFERSVTMLHRRLEGAHRNI